MVALKIIRISGFLLILSNFGHTFCSNRKRSIHIGILSTDILTQPAVSNSSSYDGNGHYNNINL